MSKDERPEDKKTGISYSLMWFALLALVAYANRGRMRYHHGGPVGFGWLIAVLVVLVGIVCIYVWWANRSDSK